MPSEWERRVLDVVIHTTGAVQGVPTALVESQPPVEDRIELGDGVWVGKIGSELAKRTMDACDPPGFVHSPPTRQYGALYSYVRERNMLLSEAFGWDEDQRLQTCIALSRLVRPTTISLEYAARVTLRLDDCVDEILPGPVTGSGSQVWLSTTTDYPNWITPKNAAELAELLREHPGSEGLPRRVSRALWHFEYIFRTYYLDIRWSLLCIALESLVHTDRNSSVNQFKRRVAQMAGELGIEVTEEEAGRAYNERSSLAHGQGLLTSPPKGDRSIEPSDESEPDVSLYAKFEEILRKVLLHSLRNKSFRDVFSDDSKIRSRWRI